MQFPTRILTESQYLNLISEIKNRLNELASSAESFLSTSTSQSELGVVTSVYIHALEEYGKLILLDPLQPQNQKVTLTSIERDSFDHPKKISLALNDLSPEAKSVRTGPFDPAIFDKFFDTGTDISWNLRLIILNSDIDKKGDPVKIPLIEKNDLTQAITALKKGQHYV